jgi:predicted  nucleic acid-binding Zn-ribbon protein
MAFEQLKAEIGLLLSEMENEPEDLHELLDQIHEKLAQMRATGMPLPADLVELERRLDEEFSHLKS